MIGFGKRFVLFGRIICSWCGKDMGPSNTDMDSHGICKSCAAKM